MRGEKAPRRQLRSGPEGGPLGEGDIGAVSHVVSEVSGLAGACGRSFAVAGAASAKAPCHEPKRRQCDHGRVGRAGPKRVGGAGAGRTCEPRRGARLSFSGGQEATATGAETPGPPERAGRCREKQTQLGRDTGWRARRTEAARVRVLKHKAKGPPAEDVLERPEGGRSRFAEQGRFANGGGELQAIPVSAGSVWRSGRTHLFLNSGSKSAKSWVFHA